MHSVYRWSMTKHQTAILQQAIQYSTRH